MGRILLIVGNGLTIDLQKFMGPKLEKWNTQTPLQWSLPTPENPNIPLSNYFPIFFDLVSTINTKYTIKNDFDLFKRCLEYIDKSPEPNFEINLLESEMQHFLALSFSYFQYEVDKKTFNDWAWLNWIIKMKESILGAVSFNYDLVLERTLDKAGIRYQRVGVKQELVGIPIVKPHGSIDFDICGIEYPTKYPLKDAILRNNGPVRRI
jgi:hypothetical protein